MWEQFFSENICYIANKKIKINKKQAYNGFQCRTFGRKYSICCLVKRKRISHSRLLTSVIRGVPNVSKWCKRIIQSIHTSRAI